MFCLQCVLRLIIITNPTGQVHQIGNTAGIATVLETGVSQHHGDQIVVTPETLGSSEHYGIDRFEMELSNRLPLCREAFRQSRSISFQSGWQIAIRGSNPITKNAVIKSPLLESRYTWRNKVQILVKSIEILILITLF